MKYYIPSALDMVALLKQHPPSCAENFEKDNLVIILNLLITIPAFNKDLKVVDGFVPIQASLLQRRIVDYKKYLDYLIRAGILDSDSHYIVGKKCIGYKFMPTYMKGIRSVGLENKKPLKRDTGNENRISFAEMRREKKILKFYNPNLKIDVKVAKAFLSEDLQIKLKHDSCRDLNFRTGKLKDPYVQYTSALVNIDKISEGNFMLSIDKTGNRLHSVLTNLSSPLRNLLTYRGKQLVSIDVKNCQPYLSSRLLSLDFWTGENDHCTQLTVSRFLNGSGFRKFLASKDFQEFVKLCSSASGDPDNDIHLYIKEAQNGTFYEYMERAIKEKTGKTFQDRKSIKQAIFQVLFTDNRFIGQPEAEPKRLFRELFPTVYKLFCLIKKSKKTILPILLQRVESYLVLKIVCKRIAKERPELPFFTIHDSVITLQGEEKYAEEILSEELTKQIGFPPAVNTEYWSREHLKLKDGSVFKGIDKAVQVNNSLVLHCDVC